MDQPILVGYEGREQGRDALRLGITLAETLDTGLVLGAAFPEIRRTGGYRAYEEALARESEPLLREAHSGPAPGSGCSPSPSPFGRRRFPGRRQKIALEGDPARALAATGRRAVDLMVVGCRGFGRARRLLAHSVSAALTASPPWPVVVVPSRAPADRAPAPAGTARPAAAPHG
jgi:nucleotide-binding universal stress UspA family protein